MFQNQSIQILIALSTIVAVFTVLYVRRSAPLEILFSLALGFFIFCGLIEPSEAWEGFANGTVIAIGSLLVVTAGLRTSGVLDHIGRVLLGPARSEGSAMFRLVAAVGAGSAFLLNTAIVAMLMPQVVQWCRRHHVSPSRLLLPISYMAILGGTCTLVGTSTNLLVNETLTQIDGELLQLDSGQQLRADSILNKYDRTWLQQYRASFAPMQMFEISKIGVPCALLGGFLLLLLGRKLLPNRTEMLGSLEDQRREYLVEMVVLDECPLIGKTVEQGGLRHLPGLFLVELDRDGDIFYPVSPSARLKEGDRLLFTGILSSIVDLKKVRGLVPASDLTAEFEPNPDSNRSLVEVVLSPSSPLVGSTIRNANFRRLYNAAVIAVHRNGERLQTKIGDIKMQAGDTLLLQAAPGFVRNFRNRPDFYLVSGVDEVEERRPGKMLLAIAITIALISWLLCMPWLSAWLAPLYGADVPSLWTSPAAAIFVAAMGMIVAGCLSTSDARNAIDFPMLLTIGAAIGVGRAVHLCGAADTVAWAVVSAIGNNPYFALSALFLITVVFTEMISNVAVAALMISIAFGMASNLQVDPRPFIITVTLAASLSFVSPIGYQTNLMVMGPGGYRPKDYLRAGLPFTLLIGSLAVVLIPLIWPF